MNSNLQSIYMTVFIAILLFTGLSFQIGEITNKNDLLSTESKLILTNYQNDVSVNLNSSQMKVINVDPDVTSGSGEEDFSREFRESKAIVSDQASTLDTIKNLPSIFVSSMGIPQDSQITFYLSLIGFTLVFLIGLAIYIAWKTGEVKNR